MQMERGSMANCFLMDSMMGCTMTIGQHMAIWNTMFNALVPLLIAMNLLFVLVVAVLFVAKVFGTSSLPFFSLPATCYYKDHPPGTIFNRFQEAFSQGILNPKSF